MPEPNQRPTQGNLDKEICSIRIMFPVSSDEQAIAYKKKITDMLVEIPDSQINFSISTLPSSPARVTP